MGIALGIVLGIKVEPKLRRVYDRLRNYNSKSRESGAEKIRRGMQSQKHKSFSGGGWDYAQDAEFGGNVGHNSHGDVFTIK